MKPNAFTLPEVLITMLIIAVVAILTYGTLKTGVQKAQQVKCIANLRQVGLDVRYYLNENNGVLPWLEQPFVTTRWWYRLYSPGGFEEFDKHLVCPADSDPYELNFKPPSQKALRCSYRFNKNFGYSESDGTMKLGGVRRNLLVAKNASRLRMVADSPGVPAEGRQHGAADSMGFNSYDEVYGEDRRSGMHLEGSRASILFLDGHIESLTADEFEKTDLSPDF